MGRSRVKSHLKKAVVEHPGEIWVDATAARAWRGAWNRHFGNNWPLRVEVGMGRGRFLADLAARGEEVNLIGLELKPDRCVTARQKLLHKARSPFLILNLPADLLEALFAPGEVDRVYLNFPDPWPTGSYLDRRLYGLRFLTSYQTILREGGELWFKSDQPGCWEELLANLPRHLVPAEHGRDLRQSGWQGEGLQTEYERRYREAGASIHYARLVKRGSVVLRRRVET
jgi:tRNA (guanine-N7-)-methyltransferase